MARVRGFEVLKDYSEVVLDIIKNDPEAEKNYGIDCHSGDLKVCYGDQDYWLPKRETDGSAGYDIRSIEDVTLLPGECVLVGTGLTAYMMIDEELQIRPRSGLAFKFGITVLNAPGTIDSDYYGKHIGVLIYNTSNVNFTIKKGDRIAQGVFSKYLVSDDDAPKKSSRDGGFGSTGV